MALKPIVNQKSEVVEGVVVGGGSIVMTASEYAEYSKSNGRIMGRLPDTKTVLTPEEFVVLHNSGWTPKMIMDKHGIDLQELQQVAVRVQGIQQLLRPITVTDKYIKF